MQSAIVIGLCGYAGSGKSEAAKYLVDRYAFTRRHMGAPLKAMLKVGFGLSDDEVDGALKESPCAKLLGKTPREAQIRLGTEFGRRMIGDNIWIETFRRSIRPHERVVNESIRFPNEVAAIKAMGGIVIRLDRGGQPPIAFRFGPLGKLLHKFGIKAGIHPSERVDLLEPDFVISNPTGSILYLRTRLDTIMRSIAWAQERVEESQKEAA